MISDQAKMVKPNGVAAGYQNLDYLKHLFMPHIKSVRHAYRLGEDEISGSRFCSDDSVWARAASGMYRAEYMPKESEITEEEIKHILYLSLQDCARADHWYRYEKDYGVESAFYDGHDEEDYYNDDDKE